MQQKRIPRSVTHMGLNLRAANRGFSTSLLWLLTCLVSLFAADLTLPSGTISGTYGPGNQVSTAVTPATTVATGTSLVVRGGKLILNPGFYVQTNAGFTFTAVPYISSAPVLGANPVTTASTTVTVAPAKYYPGESQVTYVWDVLSGPTATFSPNSTNAAKNTTVTFSAAGAYVLRCRFTGPDGLFNDTQVSCTVNSALNSIQVTPASVALLSGGTQAFTAAGKDQFNQSFAMATPTWSVSSNGGTISTGGLLTAGTIGGAHTVTATSAGISGQATVTVNGKPTVQTPASAAPAIVTGTTTTVSVLGADDGLESGLTYTWSTVGTPPAAVVFAVAGSSNGTNTAKSAVATFTQLGSYTLRCTIADGASQTVTSDVTVQVSESLSVVVAPALIDVAPGALVSFSAAVKNQFGVPAATQPTFTWTHSGSGVITDNGLLSAGQEYGGPFSVTATASSMSGMAYYTITHPTGPIGEKVVPYQVTEYRDVTTSPTGGAVKTFAYTWHGSSTAPASITVTQPVVSVAKNGSGTATVHADHYDLYGRLTWRRNGEGVITYTAYDPLSGAISRSIIDVDTTKTADFTGLPSGWSTPAGYGLHLKTDIESDRLARAKRVTDPAGSVSYKVYRDPQFEVRTYSGWNGTTNQPTGPILIEADRLAGGYREILTMAVAPVVSNGRPTGGEAIANVRALQRWHTDSHERVWAIDVYTNLTGLTYSESAPTLGVLGTNYEREESAFDIRGRAQRIKQADGTIVRVEFDAMHRVVSRWKGLDDTVASGTWSAANPGSMSRIESYEWDVGGIGNSCLTKTTVWTGSNPTDRLDALSVYDYRDRRIRETGPDGVITVTTYDNEDRITAIETYAGTIQPSSLRAKSTAAYDELGRKYREDVYEVDPLTGAVGDALTTRLWYDRRGMGIKRAEPGGLLTKTQRDGAGRATLVWTGTDTAETSYADAGTAVGDTVVQSTATMFNGVDRPICITTFKRKDTDTTTIGQLTASNSVLDVSVLWYDAAHRQIARADYGRDNGATRYVYSAAGTMILTGSVPSVAAGPAPTLTGPNTSDDYQIANYQYNDAGRLETVIDNLYRRERRTYDAAGQLTGTIGNYSDGNATATETDTDLRTDYAYLPGGRVSQVTAWKGDGTTVQQQQTRTLYLSTVDASWPTNSIDGDSADASGSGSDQVKRVFDRAGRLVQLTDQRGVQRTLVYDTAGRLSEDRVTTWPYAIAAVRRIVHAYTDVGRVASVTSYDQPTAGSILNQITYAYTGWGTVQSTAQSHAGAVTGTTPKVQYTYTDSASAGAARHVRLTGIVYPSGNRTVGYTYPANGTIGDALNRVASITEANGSTTTVAQYAHLGAEDIVSTTLPRTSSLVMDRSASGTYTGYDRFWRTTSTVWKVAGTAVDGSMRTFDRGGNVVTRQAAWTTTVAGRDEFAAYDGADRLTLHRRGILASGTIAAAAATEQTSWVLDQTGNWRSVAKDADGGGAQAAVTETRTHNGVNEIDTDNNDANAAGSAIVVGGVPSSSQPLYDPAGNMRAIPGASLYFDAWNRLIEAGSAVGVTPAWTWKAEYDGLHRQIATIANGVRRDAYLSEAGQELEIRRNGVLSEHLVWGLRHIDDLIHRHRDPGSTGVLTEAVTPLADDQGNVTAVWSDSSGQIVERYRYTPYGERTIMDGSGTVISASTIAMQHGYGTRRWDGTLALWYSRARYLHPGLGRFISRDAAGFIDGPNYYAYVRGNPWRFRDPSGYGTEGDDAPSDGSQSETESSVLGLGQEYDDESLSLFCGIGDGASESYEQFKTSPVTWVADRLEGIRFSIVHPVKYAEGINAAIRFAWDSGDLRAAGKMIYQAGEGAVTGRVGMGVAGAVLGRARGMLGGMRRPGGMAKGPSSIDGAIARAKAASEKACTKVGDDPCFIAGTHVATPEGSRAIETLQPGDLVLAVDPAEGRVMAQSIVRVFRHDVIAIADLHIETSSGDLQTLRATPEHPFWVPAQRQWIGVAQLAIGEEVLLIDGQLARVKVVDVVQLDQPVTVYNFEVEHLNTYFVQQPGGVGVLVHNTCTPPLGRAAAGVGGRDAQGVAAKSRVGSLDDMAKAAAAPDKGGLTRAGRSLDKHGSGQRGRPSPLPSPKGTTPAQKNAMAQLQVEDILTHPDAVFKPLGRGGMEVRVPDGRAMRYDADGRFAGFVD